MRSVTSLQNDTIKFVRSLEMRKVRRDTGQFVAEGASVLITARDNGHLPRTLIVRSGAQMAGEVAKLIQAVEAAGGDVIEATLEIMEKLATKDNPQSVIGVFDQLWQTPPLPASIEPEVTWLALEHVRDPGNLGTIIRTADAVGAAGVILIGTCCDPFSRECTRATMGSIFAVPLVRIDDAAGLALAQAWPGDSVGAHLSATEDFRHAAYTSPALLVMGSEGPGMTAEMASACSRLVKIPMAGELDSLNLAIAAALTLYAIRGPHLKL